MSLESAVENAFAARIAAAGSGTQKLVNGMVYTDVAQAVSGVAKLRMELPKDAPASVVAAMDALLAKGQTLVG